MELRAGTRLGPYEIVSRIGAGGMGEVFRARDTRLDRSVAIKVLTREFSDDREIRQRFEREAKTISQINHPHICTLHDVGYESGTSYLVMELLEGQSLADRLERGPLPIADVLRYGAQIAEALAGAHHAGIVHRDLKPGNIMITKAGAKLLDFGLAKRSSVDIARDGATQQKPLTQEGTILGTFQYMAPEQLEGEEADARTDIFALGAVFYEMAAGKRAFEGKTRTSLIAAIVSGTPRPIHQIQPLTPAALERVIRTCLAKDPEERWQSARDVAIELRAIDELRTTPQPTATRLLWPIVAGVLALTTIVLGGFLWREKHTRHVETSISTLILPPEKSSFDFLTTGAPPAISPDGNRIVFGATREGKPRTLWVRSLDSLTAQELPGTEQAMFPFWSPEGRFVAFFTDSALKKVEISGGAPTIIYNVADGRGGSWSADGRTIVFGYRFSGISRVPAAGGQPVEVTKLDENYSSHRWPFFLPDGRHFLYVATPVGSEDPTSAIYVGSVDGGLQKKLITAPSEPHYFNGWLLFVRDRILTAQRIDTDKLEPVGEPISLKEQQIEGTPLFSRSIVAISPAGTLVYQTGEARRNFQLTWFDRKGNVVGHAGEDAPYGMISISPDQKSVAFSYSSTAQSNLWVLDLVRGTRTRLTFGKGPDNGPAWSSDGRSVFYFAFASGRSSIYRKDIATGVEQALLKNGIPPGALYMPDVSSDGTRLLYAEQGRTTRGDISWISLNDLKTHPFLATPALETGARFSPDGKWVAYQSNESGNTEVYIAPFPPTGAKWQISTNEGVVPRWRGDGKELFYVVPIQNTLMSVPITLGATPQIGLPVLLFRFQLGAGGQGMYDVTRDGQRFLVNTRIGEAPPPAPLIVVQHFDSELRAASGQRE